MRVDGGTGGFAWCGAVRKQYAIFSRKLLEGDGYERSNSTDYKHLLISASAHVALLPFSVI